MKGEKKEERRLELEENHMWYVMCDLFKNLVRNLLISDFSILCYDFQLSQGWEMTHKEGIAWLWNYY